MPGYMIRSWRELLDFMLVELLRRENNAGMKPDEEL
jgi:hypothetical protein